MNKTIEDYKNEIDLLRTYNRVLIEKLLQLKADQPKWISVEERLPEAKTAVLAYGQRHVFNGKEIEGFPMAHVAYTRGWEEGWFSWDSDHYIDVTHWMPLPPAPNDNKEE